MTDLRPDDEQAEARQLDDEEVEEVAGGLIFQPQPESTPTPGSHGCC